MPTSPSTTMTASAYPTLAKDACAYPTLPPVTFAGAPTHAAPPVAEAIPPRPARTAATNPTAAGPRPPAPAGTVEAPSAPPLPPPLAAFAWDAVRLDAHQPLGAPATRWFGALAAGDTKAMRSLLRETGISPDLVHPRRGLTALELAATAGCAARVCTLFQLGAAEAPAGEPTALRAAARAGHAEVLDLLCHNDGNVEAVIAELRREVHVKTLQWVLQRPRWGKPRLLDDVACAAIRRDDAAALQALFHAGALAPGRLHDAFGPEGRHPMPPRGSPASEVEPLELAVTHRAWAAMRALLDCGAAAEPRFLLARSGEHWPDALRAAMPVPLLVRLLQRTPWPLHPVTSILSLLREGQYGYASAVLLAAPPADLGLERLAELADEVAEARVAACDRAHWQLFGELITAERDCRRTPAMAPSSLQQWARKLRGHAPHTTADLERGFALRGRRDHLARRLFDITQPALRSAQRFVPLGPPPAATMYRPLASQRIRPAFAPLPDVATSCAGSAYPRPRAATSTCGPAHHHKVNGPEHYRQAPG